MHLLQPIRIATFLVLSDELVSFLNVVFCLTAVLMSSYDKFHVQRSIKNVMLPYLIPYIDCLPLRLLTIFHVSLVNPPTTI